MQNITNFFYELGQLKRVKRSGWWTINIKDPESVAEHSFRAVMIGYILAKLEKADDKKVMLMCLVQDIPEARLNDLHKIGQRYIDFKEAEKKALKEQVSVLPDEIKKEILEAFDSYQNDKSKEGVVARDADLLENAIQAKEYLEVGYKDAQNWIDNVRKLLKTESAKKILGLVEKMKSTEWWKELKKVQR